MTLFEDHVTRIRNTTNEIWSRTSTLEGLGHYTSAMDDYDLRASAQNLRDAADKLDGIRDRITNGGQT